MASNKQVDPLKAERIFTLKGYLTQVLPSSIAISGVVIGACFVAAQKASPAYIAIVVLVALLGVLLPQLMNFNAAKDCHLELKERYGERYMDLIRAGKVPLYGYAISVMRSPCSHKRAIETWRSRRHARSDY